MRCESVQRELSASMHESAPPAQDVRRHVETCPVCTRYASQLHRLHQVARLESAQPVPDLAPAIMARVREERREAPTSLDPGRHRRSRAPVGRRVVAAGLAAGLIFGFVLGSGALFPSGGGAQALATEIPRRLIRAAVALRGYHATFVVTERNWSPRVPLRTFRADVAYRAPEGFRVAVRDTSRYPSPAWPRNDLELVTNGRTWQESGPNPCPPALLPACHPDTILRTVLHRAPFDQETPMPTDVIVPMTVLAALDRVRVLGPDTVDGRAAEAVSLSYEDATPLLSYLQFLGSWRPFYPQDRVVLWLDRSTWFPLRYQVFPAPGAERARWASQMGIEGDRPGAPSFSATIRSLSTRIPRTSSFRIAPAPGSVDEGFRETGGSASLPAATGLRPVRSGRFLRTAARPYDERLVAYASGLAWATVARVHGWAGRRLFGVTAFAQRVSLANGGGVAYYEPATSTDPRRVALHTPRGEYLVSSNLPQARLLELTSMLGVRGRPPPSSWFVRRWSGGVIRDGLAIRAAARTMPFAVLVPRMLPSGYRPTPAETARIPLLQSVTLVFRRPAAELDGVGIRIYESSAASLPPPQSVAEESVRVRGIVGRWSPDAHLLEWVERGAYRSITGPALDLSTLVQVADSMHVPGRA